MTADSLDFLVIGAQKSGTTTLFQWLREHPGIFVPPEKEAPFFTHPERYRRGAQYLFKRWFADAPEDRLWGKVTPHYMTDAEVPSRIAAMFPAIKLIALLRDPVERAKSHYTMMRRRGAEERDFDEAVRVQLFERNPLTSTTASAVDGYVAWGEYGRILAGYLQHFRRDQLLVLFTAELAEDPVGCCERTHRFLGVDVVHPETLEHRFHVGGTRQRVPVPLHRIKQSAIAQRLWEKSPAALARYVEHGLYWFEQWNVKEQSGEAVAVSPETERALRAHYDADLELLQGLVGEQMPWDARTP